MFTATGRITAVILAGVILCTSAYTISFASIVGYDAAMKFVTSEETEYQKKQTEIDASDLYFTGDEPINMAQMNRNGRCKKIKRFSLVRSTKKKARAYGFIHTPIIK